MNNFALDFTVSGEKTWKKSEYHLNKVTSLRGSLHHLVNSDIVQFHISQNGDFSKLRT